MTITAPTIDWYLFSDASYDSKSKNGVGAIGILTYEEACSVSEIDVSRWIQTKVYQGENIARLELMTAIWALSEIAHKISSSSKVQLVVDCRTIADLSSRRERLVERNFLSGTTGRLLNNADLYRIFFDKYDLIQPEITWVKGHRSKRGARTLIEQIFPMVDKTARAKLRGLGQR